MIKTKLIQLYTHLVRSQFAMPGVVFIMTFAFVACSIVAEKHDIAHADTLFPTSLAVAVYGDGNGNFTSTNAGNRQANTASAKGSAKDSRKNDSRRSGTSNTSTQSANVTSNTTTTQITGGSSSTSSNPSPAPVPAPAPSPSPTPAPGGSWTYPLHTGIKTTYFWAGEAASADNDWIQNLSSAWQTNWAGHFGGEDNPYSRCGYNPCAFTPRENPFYFALPFGDFTETGPAPGLSAVYWYNASAQATINSGQSILKNRWIQVNLGGKTVYAQWQDVGPFYSNDAAYVFGSAAPRSTRAGLDVSPAVRDYLGMGGSATTSWRFVTAAEVPAGPWKTTVTTSGTDWN